MQMLHPRHLFEANVFMFRYHAALTCLLAVANVFCLMTSVNPNVVTSKVFCIPLLDSKIQTELARFLTLQYKYQIFSNTVA